MGLDVGSRTIGVALSDELRLIATGLTTLTRRGMARDIEALSELIETHEVSEVVIGLPLKLGGDEGKSARRAQVLAEALKKRWTGPVEMWDERLTTTAAERVLLEADLSRRKRKKVVDKVAAVLILQGYLDRKNLKQDPT